MAAVPTVIDTGAELRPVELFGYDAGLARPTRLYAGQTGSIDAVGPTQVSLWQFPLVFNGASWDRLRTPSAFKTVDLGAATAETTIWTPAAGKKFRLMGLFLKAGVATKLTFKDNTAGTTILVLDLDAAPNSLSLGNGILSAAANNVLTVTRSVSATLAGMLLGTEEA